MALQKQPVDINFLRGIDTKTDPYQVQVGNFLRLQNSVFDKLGRLTKRNGFGLLTTLPSPESSITTFNGNLTAVGSMLQAYSAGSDTWIDKGNLQPASLITLPLIRTNTNQIQLDSVVAANNIVCTVFTDEGPSSTITYKYVLADAITGQNILPPALIPSNTSVAFSPRVFLLGNRFIIVSATSNTLEYVVINSVNPSAPTSATTITTQITPTSNPNWDGVVANNALYISWNGSDVGGAIRTTYLDSVLTLHTPHVTAGFNATLMSVSADISGNSPNIYITWHQSNNNSYTLILSNILGVIHAPITILTNVTLDNITAVATGGVQTVFYEIPNNYSYDSSIPSHYISRVTCTVGGTVGTPGVLVRSVGLASKAFMVNGNTYFLSVYQSAFQPTYFLINDSGQVVAKLAYSNAGGYKTLGLPNITINGNDVSIGYQIADLIQAVNKTQGVANPVGVYTQLGLNLVTFDLAANPLYAEIGSTLNITGGFLWGYDGYSPVENNFFVWPDNVEVTTSTSGGALADQQYFYQVIYEWTDNQGNIQRSAPSVPIGQVTSGGGTSSNTIFVPTLRLTYKLANPVKIVIYRWSTNQQNYFQVTSVSDPLLNDPTIDSVQFVDTLSDADILGNSLIYTTGGVIENIGAPSFNAVTLFDSRLWGITGEDANLLWYSKQVIEAVPVEMSDLFTLYIAPTTGAQGSTGLTKCIFPMDEKLLLFKRDSIAYINGSGPDNTGTNSQYSEPIFITGTVGCSNQRSIVMTPNGVMFQSDKGIWLIDRSLSTQYIGAPVEDFTLTATVQSAVNVPGTNQIRFTLSTGVMLMYDYFVGQWGVFTNVPSISSTLYNNLHTYLNALGQVFQETLGIYLDGSNPVLQAFTTSWIKVAGLIGFQRAYYMHLLGTYLSPHTLSVGIAYDYDPNRVQLKSIVPNNFAPPWGGNPVWGSGNSDDDSTDVWGGPTNVEFERFFFEKQKCTSFQVIIDEVYDSSKGVMPGAGLTLSGLNLTVGIKKSYPTLPSAKSFG